MCVYYKERSAHYWEQQGIKDQQTSCCWSAITAGLQIIPMQYPVTFLFFCLETFSLTQHH